ncbi:MAG: flagellar FliJ family protein [Gemmatimonas sp.]
MKAIDGLIRLHRWKLDEKRLKLAELERLVAHLRDEMRKLEDSVVEERAFAATSPEAGYAFGSFAAEAVERRRRLQDSLTEAEGQMQAAHDEVADAFRELKKFDVVKSRETRAAEDRERRREQSSLDEIGLSLYRRKQEGAA